MYKYTYVTNCTCVLYMLQNKYTYRYIKIIIGAQWISTKKPTERQYRLFLLKGNQELAKFLNFEQITFTCYTQAEAQNVDKEDHCDLLTSNKYGILECNFQHCRYSFSYLQTYSSMYILQTIANKIYQQ